MCEKHNSVPNEIYPILLDGVIVPTIWGGTKLHKMYKKGCGKFSIGEIWELSVQCRRQCRIKNGPLAGQTLNEFIVRCGNDVVYSEYDGANFPLLVKFIDATNKLSVQVHPDDTYAFEHEHSAGKNELWYIVSAEPNAEIVYGLKSQYTCSQLEQAINTGQLDGMLNRVKVKRGDVFYVPAGLVHAIGQGIIIAEIQQNSNLTYRLYDYDRRDENGNKRELHIEKALGAIKHYNSSEITKLQFERTSEHIDLEILTDNRYFTIQRVSRDSVYTGPNDRFHSLLCIEGSGYIIYDSTRYDFSAGDCWFIPAKCNAYKLTGNFIILKITPQIKNQEV